MPVYTGDKLIGDSQSATQFRTYMKQLLMFLHIQSCQALMGRHTCTTLGDFSFYCL